MGKLVLVVVLASCSALLFYLTYKLTEWCESEEFDLADEWWATGIYTLTGCAGFFLFVLSICLLTGGATLN